jgi:hypothetical protein
MYVKAVQPSHLVAEAKARRSPSLNENPRSTRAMIWKLSSACSDSEYVAL